MRILLLGPVRVRRRSTNKVGFVLAILLSIVDVIGVAFPTPEGEVGPPFEILACTALLGLVTIIAVGVGWARHNRATGGRSAPG